MTTTLETMVGEKLVIGFPGAKITPEIVQQFNDTHAGGVIFYRINFESPFQIKKLINDLEAALERKLLVCVDHEGGRVIMYRDGVTIFPDNLAFGHAGHANWAQLAGEIAGRELRALGTDVNFAPVLDVLTDSYSPNIGIRSYGKDWKQVAEMGCAYIRGLQSAGVSATAKHFPGKGHAPVDAHLKLPTILSTWDEMKAVHLQPFLQAIKDGVDCIMTSHPFYPKLDPEPGRIATFSRRIVTDFLREELQYSGLIVSDDLEMGAVKDVCPIDVAAVRTVAAGHDLVLSCHDFESQRQVYKGLLDAYRGRLLPLDELEKSVERIARLKDKRVKRFSGSIGPDQEGASLAQNVCREGLRILQDPGRLIPLPKSGRSHTVLFFPQLSSFSSKIMVEQEFENERLYLITRLKDVSGGLDVEIYPIDPDSAGVEAAGRAAKKAGVTVFFCFDAHLYPAQKNLLSALQQNSERLIVAFLRDPYDQDFLRPTDSGLTCFGWRKAQIEALLAKIFN